MEKGVEAVSKRLINPKIFKAFLKKGNNKEGVNFVNIAKKLSSKKFGK